MAIRYEEFSVENIADIVVLGMEMHEESASKDIPFDIEFAAQNAYERIISNPQGFGLVAFDGETPVGMVAGVLATHEFAPVLYAYNSVWFVLKSRRGGTMSMKLLDKFESWAKDHGAKHLQIGIASGVHPERTGKALLRAGFEETGRNYLRAL